MQDVAPAPVNCFIHLIISAAQVTCDKFCMNVHVIPRVKLFNQLKASATSQDPFDLHIVLQENLCLRSVL